MSELRDKIWERVKNLPNVDSLTLDGDRWCLWMREEANLEDMVRVNVKLMGVGNINLFVGTLDGVAISIWNIVKDDECVTSLHRHFDEYQIVTNTPIVTVLRWYDMINTLRNVVPEGICFAIFQKGNPHYTEGTTLFTKEQA